MAHLVLHTTQHNVEKPTGRFGRISTIKLASDTTVRVTVEVDSTVAAQSRYLVETWTDTGWAEVVRIYGNDEWMNAELVVSGYLPTSRSDEKTRALEEITDNLLSRASEVLGR